MSEIPNYGNHITIEKYIEWAESGLIRDYDGYGYYATEEEMTNFMTKPSDLKSERIKDKDFSHVVWFNR